MSVVALNATQQVAEAGIAPAYQGGLVATTNSYTFPNDGRTFLHLKKTGAGICAVSITPGAPSYRGRTLAALSVNVPATTGDVMMGPFSPDPNNDPATGLVSVVFSEVTGLTVAVLRVP